MQTCNKPVLHSKLQTLFVYSEVIIMIKLYRDQLLYDRDR